MDGVFVASHDMVESRERGDGIMLNIVCQEATILDHPGTKPNYCLSTCAHELESRSKIN